MDTKETEDFPEALDEDLMKRTFEAAHQDDLASRCKTLMILCQFMNC